VMKATKRLTIVIATLAAAMCFEVPSSQAQYYGDAPWCAVENVGTGNMVWYCYYKTVEECVPNVLAGNRGFCNVNPYWTASHAPNATPRGRQRAYSGR
jgi:hypothetical protein